VRISTDALAVESEEGAKSPTHSSPLIESDSHQTGIVLPFDSWARASLRLHPGPGRFAGRSTTNFLLPAAPWRKRHGQEMALPNVLESRWRGHWLAAQGAESSGVTRYAMDKGGGLENLTFYP
jgi:hypothetical protein